MAATGIGGMGDIDAPAFLWAPFDRHAMRHVWKITGRYGGLPPRFYSGSIGVGKHVLAYALRAILAAVRRMIERG